MRFSIKKTAPKSCSVWIETSYPLKFGHAWLVHKGSDTPPRPWLDSESKLLVFT